MLSLVAPLTNGPAKESAMPQAEPLPARPRRARGFDQAKPQRDPQVAQAPDHHSVEDDHILDVGLGCVKVW